MSYLKGDMGGMFKGAMNTFKQISSGGQASQNTKQTVSRLLLLSLTPFRS